MWHIICYYNPFGEHPWENWHVCRYQKVTSPGKEQPESDEFTLPVWATHQRDCCSQDPQDCVGVNKQSPMYIIEYTDEQIRELLEVPKWDEGNESLIDA